MITEIIGATPHPSLIRTHWTSRAFSTSKVDIGRLLRLLEAARWTSSYRNEQPWSFVIASKEDPVAHERLLSCLAESSIAKARRAPILVLSVVKLNFEGDARRNPYAFHDAGKAVSNLTSKAAAMGMLVHQISGFDPVRARELFDIPSGYTPVTVIAIGYPELDGPSDNPNTVGTSHTRRPLQSLAFAGRWGEASPLLRGAEPDPCGERKI